MLKYGLWQQLLDLLLRMLQALAAPTESSESSAASQSPSLHLAAFPCRLLSRTQCRPGSPSYDSYVIHIHIIHIFIISYILFLWLASLLRLLQGPKLSKFSGSLATTPVEARDGNKSTTLTYLYLTNQKLLKLGSIANLRPVRLVPTQHPAFDLPTRKIMDFGVMQAATLDMSVHEHEYSRHWMPFFDSLPLSFVLKGPREQKPSWRREGHLPKFPSRFRTPYSQRTSKHIKHGSTHH